tara:strand:+ start:37 stop:2187 length:2151 start_codon:yes stop_codon:yes gene_type:complete
LKILVLDLETTVVRKDGRIDNSPKNPLNKAVMAQYGWLGDNTVDLVQVEVFFHNQCLVPDSGDQLQEYLKEADLLVIHNAKFDVEWLLEMGFLVPDKIYCTMIAEFVLSKARRLPISLKETALRRKTDSYKKSDLVDDKFKSGMCFSEIDLNDVAEYGIADVKTCGEIYLSQMQSFEKEHNRSLLSVIKQMNDMLMFLCDIELNGTKIDMSVLEEVEKEFEAERQTLTKKLNDIVLEVMGDTPINLDSGADMTRVIFSREVKNREAHIQTFNIGTNEAGKSLMAPRMTPKQFTNAVRATTQVVYRTKAVQCPDCQGIGSIQKYKIKTKTKLGKKYRVQGEPYKNRTNCKTCKASGAIYMPTGEVAGLKLSPQNPNDASILGFKTDKVSIQRLIKQADRKDNEKAVQFLTMLTRLHAVSTYLNSFVAGIKRGVREDGLLHANFNQCIAATGRLSSGGGMSPNLQNQPKRGFPVRKAFISRFEGGTFLEADYSGLEFRVCVELSRDSQGLSDILKGKDIHRQTASIIGRKSPEEVTKEERQKAKAYTFLPLFGGTGAGEAEHIRAYFSQFYEVYQGIYSWHQRLMDGALRNGIVETPSGRQYYWPSVVRVKKDRVSNATQILNYPVQGFAADIVQLACIRARRKFNELNLKSKLILTVHDSICVDVYPNELDTVKEALTWAMTGVNKEAQRRWNYNMVVPLEIEISGGNNWLDQKEYA